MKYLIMLLLLTGCDKLNQTPPSFETKPVSAPVVVESPKVERLALAWGTNHSDWDKALYDELAALPDVEIPGLPCKKLKTKDCVAQLMSIMAKYESGFDPKNVYHEPPPLGVDSIGLFQLSIESEKSLCSLKSKDDLKEPITNIKCAVKVLSKWVQKDGVLFGGQKGAWRGGSRYWSVLRTTSGSYSKIMNYMSQF